MKTKKFKETYDKKIEKKDKEIKSAVDIKWISTITISAFFITIVATLLSDKILENVNIFAAIMVIIFFIVLGVIFDMIGIAVTSSDEEPFHSMSTKKIKGSKLSVRMIKNAEKVSAFSNDVIGDICNIMSGSAGIVLSGIIATDYQIDLIWVTLLVTSIIAALTIGGKALGKSYAINKSELIVYQSAKFLTAMNAKRRKK